MSTLVGLLISASALGQVPTRLGYQGRLFNAAGTPVTGPQPVSFALFAAPTGGTALWSEAQTLIFSDGFFATYLGDTTPPGCTGASCTGIPATVFGGSERYLEVGVAGATLAPRQRVTSVAYALMCTTARNLAGGTVDASGISVNGATVFDGTGRITAAAGYTAGPGIAIDATARTVSLQPCPGGSAPVSTGASYACAPAGSGTVTNVSGTAPVSVSNGSTTPIVSVAIGTGAGTLAAGNDARFLDATSLQGRAVAATAPATGQVLQWSGTNWAPAAAPAPSFAPSFISAAQVITPGGALTLPHGLGGMPELIQARLRCVTAQHGYAIGDEVIWQTTSGSTAGGLVIVPDATNVNVRYGVGPSLIFRILHKTSGNFVDLSEANWRVVIRAWR